MHALPEDPAILPPALRAQRERDSRSSTVTAFLARHGVPVPRDLRRRARASAGCCSRISATRTCSTSTRSARDAAARRGDRAARARARAAARGRAAVPARFDAEWVRFELRTFAEHGVAPRGMRARSRPSSTRSRARSPRCRACSALRDYQSQNLMIDAARAAAPARLPGRAARARRARPRGAPASTPTSSIERPASARRWSRATGSARGARRGSRRRSRSGGPAEVQGLRALPLRRGSERVTRATRPYVRARARRGARRAVRRCRPRCGAWPSSCARRSRSAAREGDGPRRRTRHAHGAARAHARQARAARARRARRSCAWCAQLAARRRRARVVVNAHAHPESLRAALRDAPAADRLGRSSRSCAAAAAAMRGARAALDGDEPFLVVNGDMCLELDVAVARGAAPRRGGAGHARPARRFAQARVRLDRLRSRRAMCAGSRSGSTSGARRRCGLFIGVQVMSSRAVFARMPARRRSRSSPTCSCPRCATASTIATWLQPAGARWWPVGSPAELLDANLGALERGGAHAVDPTRASRGRRSSGPVWIGAGARVAAGARIGPHAVVSRRAREVGAGAALRERARAAGRARRRRERRSRARSPTPMRSGAMAEIVFVGTGDAFGSGGRRNSAILVRERRPHAPARLRSHHARRA